MINKGKIIEIARQKGRIYSSALASEFGVSRQYISLLIAQLVAEEKLLKLGGTRSASYISFEYAKEHPEVLPTSFKKKFKNQGLEEHAVLIALQQRFPALLELDENVRTIFNFAFSEMFNNAIEHSMSKSISVELTIRNGELSFIVEDSGVGVFRNIMKKRGLRSEVEAMQDLLKGKITTMPTSHSGEGIFFTSKSSDLFILDSFGQQLVVNTISPDTTIRDVPVSKRGTRVVFKIKTNSDRHLKEVFQRYTNLTEESDYGFDKTEIRVKLYTMGGVHISRSQARRILSGLENFKIILFDYDKVPIIGQAFADEIYRVFARIYHGIKLEDINMNDGIRFMVERAKNEAKRAI
ncbi:MAG: DUF4325 domain-containing protein [Patescibacteria group bacterium]